MKEITRIHLDTVNSTNTYIKERFDQLSDATLVTAGEQTAGRGRLDRKWLSPKDQNIYASFLMKEISQPFYATIVSSLAVLQTLRATVPDIDCYIKWPNDIYVEDAKIAGILSEGIWQNGKLAGIIGGMGININLDPEDLKKIDQRAVSLYSLYKTKFNLKKVTDQLAKSLLECYILYSSFPDTVFAAWKAENRLLGRTLEFIRPDGTTIQAVMQDIRENGSVIIQYQGITEEFTCGDLRVVKESLLKK